MRDKEVRVQRYDKWRRQKKTRVTTAAGSTAGAHKIKAKSRRPVKRDSRGAPQALTQTQISTLLKFPKVSRVPSNAEIK